MTWSKMSDDWPDHPKVVMCSDAAVALWMRSIAYANRHSTDGFVPSEMLPRLTRDRRPNALSAELVNAIPPTYSKGLWEPVEGGWMIHDFLDYSPSRADVVAKRRADAERQSRHRATRDSQSESRCDNAVTHGVSPSVPSRPVPTHTDPEPERSAPRKRGSTQLVLKPGSAKPEPSPDFCEVRDCWFREFESTKRAKPTFGNRDGKDIKTLLEKAGSAARACEIIRAAFADASWVSRRATLADLASNPNQFVGSAPAKSYTPKGPPVQPRATSPGSWHETATELVVTEHGLERRLAQ